MGEIDRFGFVEEDGDVPAVGQDSSDRLSDIGIGETGGGQLVEEGLKEVMILAIDQGDFRPVFGEGVAKGQPGETRSNDDDSGSAWGIRRVGRGRVQERSLSKKRGDANG